MQTMSVCLRKITNLMRNVKKKVRTHQFKDTQEQPKMTNTHKIQNIVGKGTGTKTHKSVF